MNIDVLSGVSRNEGGLFFSVRCLSQALAKKGLNIQIVSHIDKHAYEDMMAWQPLPVSLYSCIGPMNTSLRLRRLLRDSTADLLHVHGIWQDRQWAALQWQKRTGKPVIISPRGMLDSWAVQNAAWKKKFVGRLFARESLERATCIHVLCQAEAESIRAYGLTNPIAIIPNGVKLPDQHSINRNLQKDSGRYKRLLYLGRIHPKKGLSELVAAWNLFLKQTHCDSQKWQLVIAGWDDGGHLKNLQKQATSLNISWASGALDSRPCLDELEEKTLIFCDPVFGNDKDALFRIVDAFILPSLSEGLPISVLEAWSYELPVIMTDFCNLPEGFKSNAAIRVEPNAQSILQGITKLVNLSDLDCYKKGFNGRILTEQKFDWEIISQDMVAVYRWCLGGEKPRCIRM